MLPCWFFSSLSSYSTHKRRTLSSCETTRPAATFHHRSANCSTFVLPCNWLICVNSKLAIIHFWHFGRAPACTTRWLAFQPQPFLQVAPLSCTMRVWRRCVRRRSSSVSTSKISTCCWDWSPSVVTQIIRIYSGFPTFQRMRVTKPYNSISFHFQINFPECWYLPKKNNASIIWCLIFLYSETPKSQDHDESLSILHTFRKGTVLSRSASSSSRSPRRASAAASSLGDWTVAGWLCWDILEKKKTLTVGNMNQRRKFWQFGTLSENICCWHCNHTMDGWIYLSQAGVHKNTKTMVWLKYYLIISNHLNAYM